MMRAMRILMFSAIFPPAIGGPATQCFNLCKALREKGVTPVVVTYYGSKKFSVSEEYGFKVYLFKSVYTKTPLDKAIRWVVFPFYIFYLLKKERIQILHCHSVSALSFAAAFVAKFLGIPRVIKFAGDWVWETLSSHKLQAENFKEIYQKSAYARFLTKVERAGLRLFNVIWVVSDFRKENIRFLTGTIDNVVIIPNCLALSGGGPHISKAGDPTVIVSANRFIPHKRIDLIVRLFAKLALPDVRLVLIGGGDESEVEKVRKTIQELGVVDKVEVTGILPTEEVYDRFKKASFYISVSLEEGMPNVFIEAMHYGLPVITSDAGGSKEIVVDRETGFIVNPYDESGFLERMKKLGLDVETRNMMSKKAFERSEHFNLRRRIGEFIAMYQRLLK